MPTGYTAPVSDGTVTDFKTFAMQCARAFGALVTMRDDPSGAPIPERFEPSTGYYDEMIAKSEARLTELRAMTVAEAKQAAMDAHIKAMEDWHRYKQERAQTRSRYETMLAKVAAWEPPTADHRELKTFMIQQLRESIRFDTESYDEKPPTTPGGETWRQEEIRHAERKLNYAIEHRAQEIARTAQRNEWLAALRASLAQVDEAAPLVGPGRV